MIILLHIFWFFGLINFISLFGYIFNFKKINYSFEWHHRYNEIIGRKPKKHEFRNQKDYDIFINRGILGFFELIWILFGLLTNNWIIFLVILIISLVINFGLDKWRFSFLDKSIRFLFTVFKCLTYITLIIQYFH
jgi:hypothetical protein